MTTQERILLIDSAIDDVLDNLKVVKRSPLELISELRRIRASIIKDAQKAKATSKTYIFGDRY